jgi:hypothetical protein
MQPEERDDHRRNDAARREPGAEGVHRGLRRASVCLRRRGDAISQAACDNARTTVLYAQTP